MKKVLVTFVLLAALIVFAGFGYQYLADKYNNPAETQSSESAGGTTVGLTDAVNNPATDFTMQDADGNDVKLSSLYGKTIVLNFWATWCGYCVDELPDFQKVYDKYGSEVQFVMVNLTDGVSEKVSSSKAFIQEKGYTFPVYFDVYQQGLDAYSATSIPRTYIIDEKGNLIESHIGALDEDGLLKLLGY